MAAYIRLESIDADIKSASYPDSFSIFPPAQEDAELGGFPTLDLQASDLLQEGPLVALLLPAVQSAREASRTSEDKKTAGHMEYSWKIEEGEAALSPVPHETTLTPKTSAAGRGPFETPGDVLSNDGPHGQYRYNFEAFHGEDGDVPEHQGMTFEADLYTQDPAKPIPTSGQVAASATGDGHHTIAFEATKGGEFDVLSMQLGVVAGAEAEALADSFVFIEIQGFRDGFEMPLESWLTGYAGFQFESEEGWAHATVDPMVLAPGLENVDRVEIRVWSDDAPDIDLAPVLDNLSVDFA
ncbi:MAG: hypothetical protein AAFS08_17555 [Pseudomonadota bacterium]